MDLKTHPDLTTDDEAPTISEENNHTSNQTGFSEQSKNNEKPLREKNKLQTIPFFINAQIIYLSKNAGYSVLFCF